MKIKRAIAVLFASILAMVGQGLGQSYGEYTTVTIDSTGKVKQTVVLEGSTSMVVSCQPYRCGMNQWCTIPNCPYIHQPKIYNHIGTVGGWSYGSWYTPSQYISYQSYQEFNPITDDPVAVDNESAVYCTAAGGNVYDMGEHGKVYPLETSSCDIDPITHHIVLLGGWGDLLPTGGCNKTEIFDVPPDPGMACITVSGTKDRQCFHYPPEPDGFAVTICPVLRREISNDCARFLSEFADQISVRITP